MLLGLVATPGVARAEGGAVGSGGTGVIGGDRLAAAGEVVDTAAAVPPLPAVTATSFVVADADTGAVLAAKSAHLRLAPASTLKTLTALTLIPRLAPAVMTVAGRDAPSVDGTKAGIVAGMHYSAGDLFTAMLMMSANDAAVALADANGGLDVTLAQMNAEAARLNADDTVAKTPNGLDAPGQSSSAYDLALFFRAGLADARFRHYLAVRRAPFPAPGGTSFQIQTHDRLLNSYPGMIGGKNGYTVAAQASYVGAASRGGRTIIVAVMRDQPNFWAEVAQLLDWGFAADAVAEPVGTLVPPGPLASKHAASPGDGAVRPGAAGPSAAPVPAGVGGAGSPEGRSASGAAAAGGNGGNGLSSVMAWVAVGVGGLVLLLALGQTASRLNKRGRRFDRDEHYLAGLSRLSGQAKFHDPT
jgi:D-alanyl-D-alanine carboxypeptidase (penicillin-binding protein 5/6)